MNNVILHSSDRKLFEDYVNLFKEVGADGSIAIARSNRMVNSINRAVRRELFGELDLPIEKNDVLLVIHNNYAVPLANGDFVTVIALGEKIVQAGLYFQKVKIRAMLSDTEYDMFISLDILYGTETNFTKSQLKTLMTDFNRRVSKKGIEINSDEYRDTMLKDPYLNCLRSKFGYAVTSHKAQGGEWNDVFLFLEKSMYAMNREELIRWWYTAITRTRKKLHLADNWWIV
jgi:hypothetical protein